MSDPTKGAVDRDRAEKQHQVSIDFFKHLTTLSSGAILLTATVYDKLKDLFTDPRGIVVCIVLFLLALMSSLAGHAILVVRFGATPSELTKLTKGAVGSFLFVSGIFFLGALAYFTSIVIAAR